MLDRTQHKIRLEHIDAPESGQAFGTKAMKVLGDKVFGKEVRIEWKSRDRWGRIIGLVFVEDRNINLEMVQEGFAWHFLKYSRDQVYAKAQADAKDAKKGLWVDAKQIPPWEYRKNQKLEDPDDIDPEKFKVVVTPKGKKYHRAGCSTLSKSVNVSEVSLKEAASRLDPCAKCKPPEIAR